MLKLKYRLTSAALKKHFVATGEPLDADQYLEFDPRDLRPEDRQFIADSSRLATGIISLNGLWSNSYGNGKPFADSNNWLRMDTIADDPAALLAAYRAALEESRQAAEAKRDATLQETIARLLNEARAWPAERGEFRRVLDADTFAGAPGLTAAQTELAAAIAETNARVRAYQAEREAAAAEKAAADAAEKQARLDERAAWARAHGSSHLKKCVDAGYDCQRLYVTERAAIEFPGYVVDFNDRATWKSRSGPSEAALDEAARVNGEVVWLTTPPDPAFDDRYEEFEPREAIVIRGYLGKYDLVRVM